jgi:hypothetical protein
VKWKPFVALAVGSGECDGRSVKGNDHSAVYGCVDLFGDGREHCGALVADPPHGRHRLDETNELLTALRVEVSQDGGMEHHDGRVRRGGVDERRQFVRPADAPTSMSASGPEISLNNGSSTAQRPASLVWVARCITTVVKSLQFASSHGRTTV